MSSTRFFSYTLPPERIAQRPVHPAPSAKMVVLQADGRLLDCTFFDFPQFVRTGDLVVFNNTKVIPARFVGNLAKSGGGVELFILQKGTKAGEFIALGKPLKKFKIGTIINFAENLQATIVERLSERTVLAQFSCPADLSQVMHRVGLMPIPPYIRKGISDAQDVLDYQTVFAQQEGSVAAPTASLHFDQDLLGQIQKAGAEIRFVTLHVGAASLSPLISERPEAELYFHDNQLYSDLIAAKKSGRRIIGVGTTAVRALETLAQVENRPDGFYPTDLFIQPGFSFHFIDLLVTNFHQPETTHLALVEAFIGTEYLKQLYDHALGHDYRFLSYGDGCLLSGC